MYYHSCLIWVNIFVIVRELKQTSKQKPSQVVVAHSSNLSTKEAETGEFRGNLV